jgi:LysM repeat protein
MTCRQMAFIVVVNALISTLISVGVVLLVIRTTGTQSTVTQLAVETPPVATPLVVVPATATQSAETPAIGASVAGTVEPTTQTPAQAAEATAPAAATFAAGADPVVYVVQPGDTLSSLALEYDVSEADIMAANQLRNPDFLPAGVRLVIPVDGVPPATARWTPIPMASGTSIPFEPPSAHLTATVSTQSDNAGTARPTADGFRVEIIEIGGAGDLEQERVLIGNLGELLADMAGWTLSDTDGNTYVFPNYRLWSEGTVTVHTRTGQNGNPVTSLFWGKMDTVWSPGEVATLRNAVGEVVTTYIVSP